MNEQLREFLEELCKRFPTKPIIKCGDIGERLETVDLREEMPLLNNDYDLSEVVLVLRPLTSITDEETNYIKRNFGVMKQDLESKQKRNALLEKFMYSRFLDFSGLGLSKSWITYEGSENYERLLEPLDVAD